MLKIRLQRVGRKNDPSFRMVVTESQHGPQSGKFLEVVGAYDARHGQPQIKADRVKHWLSMGAQASGTVHNLLIDGKVIEGKKVNVLPKRKPVSPEAVVSPAKTEVAPEAEAAPTSEAVA